MPGEDELQNLCVENIQSNLEELPYSDLQVGSEVAIMKDCTFVYDDEVKLYLGHAKTDVAIYLESPELTSHLDESDHFKLYQNGDKEIRIPLVIIETKRGDEDGGGITTDSIRSRTIIAREINEIFPFCTYVFLADRASAVSPEKLHRAGKHFERFYTFDAELDPKTFNEDIYDDVIVPHLKNLSREGILSKID